MTGYLIVKAKKNESLPNDLEKMATTLAHRGQMKSETINKHDFFGKLYLNHAQADNELFVNRMKSKTNENIFLDGQIKFDNKQIKSCDTIFSNLDKDQWKIFRRFDGLFSMVIQNGEKIYAAKDSVGFNPLYYLESNNYVAFSSELKALRGLDGVPTYVQPGEAVIFDGHQMQHKWYKPISEFASVPLKSHKDLPELTFHLFNMLDNAVKKNLEVPCKVSALLSGGIDSTVICALAMEHHLKMKGKKLEVYTAAVEGSEDLVHAKRFAELHKDKINHNIFVLTLTDMQNIIPEVIFHLETFDAALIRSAIPMFFVCSKISKDTGILLTGEGGDELFGGYDYLKDLSSEALNREFIEFMKIEHATGLQRVDRIPYAFGFDARAPWFDSKIVEFAFEVPIDMKLKTVDGKIVEKWIARETFKAILPPEITWRKKAKFSNGVGSEFLMRDYLNKSISDDEFEQEREIFPNQFVKSKEELYYWRIFKEKFNPCEEFIKNLPRTSNFDI